MSVVVDVEPVSSSMWRARDRFPLAGVSRQASELPEDETSFPFGLTRLVTVESAANRATPQLTYDPELQMSRIDGAIAAHKTDIYCDEDTEQDMQKYNDKNVDDSKDDS